MVKASFTIKSLQVICTSCKTFQALSIFPTVTYLTGSHSTLERVCAHLVFTNATPEVLVAFLVAYNWYLCHVEDSLISSPFKDSDKEVIAS